MIPLGFEPGLWGPLRYAEVALRPGLSATVLVVSVVSKGLLITTVTLFSFSKVS